MKTFWKQFKQVNKETVKKTKRTVSPFYPVSYGRGISEMREEVQSKAAEWSATELKVIEIGKIIT